MATVERRDRKGAEQRLDPVRWHRPGRGTLVRLGAVAVLLVTAVAVIWSRPPTCAPATGPPGLSSAGQGSSSSPSNTASGAVVEAHTSHAGASHAGSGAQGSPAGTGAEAALAGSGAEAPPAGTGASPAGTGVPPGSVGVPVRLAEPTALTLVHPGDRVDLLRVDENGETTSVAAAALVLGVTGADDPTAGGLLLALKPAEARKAVATPGHGFAVLIRPD